MLDRHRIVPPGIEFEDGVVRIDGQRTEECKEMSMNTTCMTAKGFTFYDPAFKNSFSNYIWDTNPGIRPRKDSDCLVLNMYKGQNVTVDIRSCTEYGPGIPMGFLCRRASWS